MNKKTMFDLDNEGHSAGAQDPEWYHSMTDGTIPDVKIYHFDTHLPSFDGKY